MNVDKSQDAHDQEELQRRIDEIKSQLEKIKCEKKKYKEEIEIKTNELAELESKQEKIIARNIFRMIKENIDVFKWLSPGLAFLIGAYFTLFYYAKDMAYYSYFNISTTWIQTLAQNTNIILSSIVMLIIGSSLFIPDVLVAIISQLRFIHILYRILFIILIGVFSYVTCAVLLQGRGQMTVLILFAIIYLMSVIIVVIDKLIDIFLSKSKRTKGNKREKPLSTRIGIFTIVMIVMFSSALLLEYFIGTNAAEQNKTFFVITENDVDTYFGDSEKCNNEMAAQIVICETKERFVVISGTITCEENGSENKYNLVYNKYKQEVINITDGTQYEIITFNEVIPKSK